jgi:hypothetical protein
MYVDTFLRKRVWWIPTDSRENDVSQRFRREHADTNTPTVNAPTVTKRGGGNAACRAKDKKTRGQTTIHKPQHERAHDRLYVPQFLLHAAVICPVWKFCFLHTKSIMGHCNGKWGTHLVMSSPLADNVDQMYKSKEYPFPANCAAVGFAPGSSLRVAGRTTCFIFYLSTRLLLNTSSSRKTNLLDLEINCLMCPDLTC